MNKNINNEGNDNNNEDSQQPPHNECVDLCSPTIFY